MVEHYWKTKKGSHDPRSVVILKCGRCGKKFERDKWYQDRLAKLNKGKGFFCSSYCATLFHNTSEETKKRISEAQRGVSVLSRGRKGHEVSAETRERIRLSKLGKKIGGYDFQIILKEIGIQKPDRAVPLFGLIPDAIMLEGNKLIALEVQKKPNESEAKIKMIRYENVSLFDEIRIVWYDRQGKRVKEWRKINGDWSIV